MDLTSLLGIALGALFGGGGVVAYLRLKTVERPTSEAGVEKTHADAELVKAQAEKTRAEAHQTDSAILLETLNAVSAERASLQVRIGELTEMVTTQGREIRQASGEIGDLRGEFELRIEEARKSLAKHGQWDRRVYQLAKTIDPDFPEPPPLRL